jgi:antitoxin CptB
MDEVRVRRAIYRARYRGFREADMLIGPFAEKCCPGMSDEEMDQFEVLLQIPDHDLYGWIIERDPVPPEHDVQVLHQMQTFRLTLAQDRGTDLGA